MVHTSTCKQLCKIIRKNKILLSSLNLNMAHLSSPIQPLHSNRTLNIGGYSRRWSTLIPLFMLSTSNPSWRELTKVLRYHQKVNNYAYYPQRNLEGFFTSCTQCNLNEPLQFILYNQQLRAGCCLIVIAQ